MKEPSRVRVAGPLQPFARGFGEHLMRQGYARSSAVAQVQLMAHLSRWMAAEGVPAAGLTPARLEQFVGTRRAAGYRHFVSPPGWLITLSAAASCWRPSHRRQAHRPRRWWSVSTATW